MPRSFKLGSAFGIGIYVHWTFWMLLVYVVVMTISAGILAALLNVLVVLIAFGCVVFHEFGHALTARRFGIGTRDITLSPIGGVARLERMSEKPWEEFWIAIAGPAVNVAIAVLILVGMALAGISLEDLDWWSIVVPHASLAEAPLWQLPPLALLKLNLILLEFNMIPAFPMDGGRVFRAVLAHALGHLRATEIAAKLGLIFAGLFVVAGLLFAHPILFLVGFFVMLMGQQELAMVRFRAKHGCWPWELQGVDGSLLLDPSALPNEPNYSGFTWDRRARAWIEWREGRPIHACCQQ